MAKRNESHLQTECLKYLRILENAKKIAYYDRLNSGIIFTGHRKIQLCRDGTADIYVRLNTGKTIWVECKMPKNTKITPLQAKFRLRMELIGDSYHVVTTTFDLIKRLEREEVEL